jgi:FixJ family two-component response regulator
MKTDSPPNSPTVFVVDDDPDLRDALAMLMRAAGLHTEGFSSARDFLQRLDSARHGCLILDIRMPGMSGMELQAELRKRRIDLPIVFLTGHGDVPLAVKAIKAGAADFILKPLDEHRLVLAVMNALKTSAEPASPAPLDTDKLAGLSKRELDVLHQLVEGKQNREIAAVLCISVKTVEFHRANIREKLGVTTLPELFRLVMQALGEHPGTALTSANPLSDTDAPTHNREE